jgi:hypothetical protein
MRKHACDNITYHTNYRFEAIGSVYYTNFKGGNDLW